MAKKSMVLRGLTALLTFVFSLSIVTGVTLEGYKSTIDTNLGTQSEKFVSESTMQTRSTINSPRLPKS